MVFSLASARKGRPGGALSFRAGVAVLLLLYVAAFVYSPVGVPHIHHEDEIHKGDACHSDACHISVYHPGVKGGCNHKSHITLAVEECDLCNVILPRQVLTDVPPLIDIFRAYPSDQGFCLYGTSLVFVCHHADRGPPSDIS